MKQFVPVTPLGELVAAHRDQLLAAAERRHARDVRLFGSVARGDDSSESDVELVTLDDSARPLDLLSLACDAEDILGVRVDVGTVENIWVGDEGARDAVEQLSRDIGMDAVYGGPLERAATAEAFAEILVTILRGAGAPVFYRFATPEEL